MKRLRHRLTSINPHVAWALASIAEDGGAVRIGNSSLLLAVFRPMLAPRRMPVGAEGLDMPLFLIERAFAEAVQTDPERDATIKQVNDEIGIQWLFSFLSADKRKSYCLYEAPNPQAIRAAAQRLGVPADTIVEVDGIGPQAALVAAARV